MKCPQCNNPTKVIDSRECSPYRFIASRRRRRQCLSCGDKFTTYEFYREDFIKIEANVENFRKKFAGFIKVVNDSAIFLGLAEGVRLEE